MSRRKRIVETIRADHPAPDPEHVDRDTVRPTYAPPFESHADRAAIRSAHRVAGHYVDHEGTVRTGRVFVADSSGTVIVRRLVAEPFRPARRHRDLSPTFTGRGVPAIDAWTLALILDRDAADSTVARIEREDDERRTLSAIMRGEHTEGSSGLPWDSVFRRAPSVAQNHERVQINYSRSVTAPGPDGVPLGTVLRVDGADGRARAIDPTVAVRADRIRAARKRWDGAERTVRCDADTDDGRRTVADACGECRPCKARARNRRHDEKKREAVRQERAEQAERVTAWERAHGRRVASRHGI